MAHHRAHHRQDVYRLRILGSMAASLLLLVVAVRVWPVGEAEPDEEVVYAVGRETIEIEEIRPTRQARRAAPPPAPPLPVVVPNDELLEDFELDLSDSFLIVEEPGDDAVPAEGSDAEDNASGSIEVGPKPLRFVEPEYTRAARRREVRAEVVIEVTVDADGRVQAVRILDRYLLTGEERTRQKVAEIGYGLEEAAVSAAERWLFRPARRDGKLVPSTTTLTFSFGV